MGRKIERENFFSTLISTAMYAVGGGVEGFGPWSSTSARRQIEDLDGHFVSSKIEVKINNRLRIQMITFQFEDLTENS